MRQQEKDLSYHYNTGPLAVILYYLYQNNPKIAQYQNVLNKFIISNNSNFW